MQHHQPTTRPDGRRRGPLRRVAAFVTATIGAAAALAILPVAPAQAAVYCGLNELDQNVFQANDGLWSNPLNWSRLHLPTSGEAVCVPGGIVARVSSASSYLLGAQDGYVTTLRVEGTVRIEGGNTVSLASAIYGGSNLINGGVIQVLGGSTFDMNADQNGAPAFQNVVGGSLIQVSSGSTILLRRPFLNTGTINLTGGGQMVLDSAASAYSTGGSGGTIIGGQLRLTGGTVTYDGSGTLSVLATAGSIRGTLNASQSLDVACSTFSGGIDLSQGLTSNGTIRFLAPLAGNCEMDYTLPAGKTFTNNGSLTFGTAGTGGGNSVRFSSNFYNRDGLIVNGPTGTITVNDYWSALEQVNNQGTITIASGGFMQQPYNPLVNTGTFVNGDRCDLKELNSSGGTVELKASCGVRTKATFTSTSTLRPHSSSAALAKLVVGQSSPIGGTVDVITDGTPPALGTTRDLITGPVSGTFASVTSQSGAVGYSAVYTPGAVQLTTGQGTGSGTGQYVPVVPARLLETRSDVGLSTVDGLALAGGVVPAGGVVELQVAGRPGIPADAAAVVLNVAVTGTQGAGFVTVFPCGSDRPNAANLNYSAGQTVPNLVIAKIGAGGKVCLFTLAATHLIADVNGYFPAGSSYAPLVPARLLETRSDVGLSTVDGLALAGGVVPAGGVVELQVAGRPGIPADAAAVVLNVAVTGTQGAGFVTVFPCGSDRPNAANLNYSAGETVPNLVIAKIGTGGKVCLFTLAATHLIADVNGYFPAGSSYAPLVPARLLETRSDVGLSTVDGLALAGGVVPAGGVVELQVAGRPGIPADAAAVVLNVAVTGTQGAGFVTVFPCGSDRPNAANLNYSAGQTVPNLVIAKIGTGGKVCLFTLAATHLIADVNGYFPGG